MTQSQPLHHLPGLRMSKWLWIFFLLWTILILISFTSQWFEHRSVVEELAKLAAASTFQRDILYRKWVTEQGGVYVPPTEATPPNPYLHIEDRDVTTTLGKHLTLVNPAYMTRQIYDLTQTTTGVRGHITSLEPLNPNNAPDAWEKTRLEQFQRGIKETSSLEKMNGQLYLRYMQPLQVEAGCIRCHAEEGYKVGDLRGGISISVPMEPYYASQQKEFSSISLLHAFLWVFGLAVGWIGQRRMQRGEMERISAIRELQESEQRFRIVLENIQDAYFRADNNGRFTYVSPSAAAMYGYDSAEEMVGMTAQSLYFDSEERESIIEEMKNNGKIHDHIGKGKKKDGSQFWVSLNSQLFLDGNGQMVGTEGFVRNITERKLAEEALRVSEEKYRLLFMNNPLPMWVYDTANLGFLAVNDFAVDHYGYSRQEFLAMTIKDIRPPEDIPYLFDVLDKFKGSMRSVGAARHRTKNGSIIDVDITAHEIDFDGRKAMFVIAIDITEQKQSRDLLQQSEEKFKAAFMTSPDSININRLSDGRYIAINQGFTRIMGYTEEETIGKSSLELDIWIDTEERKKLVAGLKVFGKVDNLEARFRAKDGSHKTGLMSATIIQLNNEPHILSITRDITEVKRLQLELFQSQKMLSMGTLAGGIAHDFNNILNIILGYSGLLKKKKDDPEKFDESINAITHAVERGAALVKQILTFARKTEVSFEPISIPDLVKELCSMLEQTFPKVITFKKQMEDQLPLIHADHSQLHQVLLNLCVNARDAMPHGGTITIATEVLKREQICERFPSAEQEQYVCLSVADTGEGMNELIRSRIFDPFFTTKGLGKGTGLGLSVVYGVIQSHRGFIDVKSTPGEGSVFLLFLPVPAVRSINEISHKVEEREVYGNGETILVVEDEDMLLETLSFILESNGFFVLRARDGVEAVSAYREHRREIAMVVTDMGLPSMTGIDEFMTLKELNPEIKVLFTSGFFGPDLKTELQANGAKGFIQKPYRPEEILRMIRTVLDEE
jgi:two-component system, cell cycle sensor histidine kinase and response regulator CckA